MRVEQFNKHHMSNYIVKYITGIDKGKPTIFKCPDILKYQFEEAGKYNYSNKCCYKLKKELMHNYQKKIKRKITITGMRAEEGGNRAHIGCVITKGNDIEKFHPLIVVTEEWEHEFIKREKVELCELYYPPYNFKRTGCKGCPFALTLQEQLITMKKLLPNEYKQCLYLWKPVYDEYIRIGFRLKYYPHEKGVQMTIDDFLDEKE